MTKIDKEIREGLFDPGNMHIKEKYLSEIDPGVAKYHRRRKTRFFTDKLTRDKYVELMRKRGYSVVKDFHNGVYRVTVGPLSLRVAKKHRQLSSRKGYDPKSLSSPPTRWYKAMVRGIKRGSDVKNPYAVVKSIWSRLSPSKKAEIRLRERKGERFKYDLPLPVDYATKGTGTVRTVKPFKLAEVQVNLSVKDYLDVLKSGLFNRMKRHDGTTALVARCKSPTKNVNVFVDKTGGK